jgi:DNA-binding XRE family transcriptional regulator
VKATKLKQWRESMGQSQVMLAESSGVSEYTILRVENGHSLRPSTARKLARRPPREK